MAPGSTAPEIPAFAVELLRVRDGVLHVQGQWSGIRGMRFLRPTLITEDGRQVLATLEHKPWAPTSESAWMAAFPWDGTAADAGRAHLEVAPSVLVPLGAGDLPLPVPVVVAPMAASVARATRADVPAPEPEPSGDEGAAGRRLDERTAVREREEAAGLLRRTAAERDRAIAMRDEAVRDREAAVRTRDRMAPAGDEAETAHAAAEHQREEAVAAATRDRDAALGQVTTLKAQREEILLAHRSLEAVLDRERAMWTWAEGDRVPTGADRHPGPAAAAGAAGEDGAREVPIGVRAVPAARAVPADLLAPRAATRAALGSFDRWALRVLATAAASCFVLLLLLLLQLFL